MIPGESITTQYRLIILYVHIRRWREKKNKGWGNPRITWQNLRAKKQVLSKNNMVKEGKWGLDKDANRFG